MRTNPFLYIVQLIGTLVLIPTAWKGSSPVLGNDHHASAQRSDCAADPWRRQLAARVRSFDYTLCGNAGFDGATVALPAYRITTKPENQTELTIGHSGTADMRTNPFLYIVHLIGTLVLIPTAWKGSSPSSETIITLLPNGATAQPILGGGNWPARVRSFDYTLCGNAGFDGATVALPAYRITTKPENQPELTIGHGGTADMRTNPFLYIVQLIGTLVLIPTA
ncbi:hypothetical protein MTO96_040077 [Rhipicephalus appendiculatus]